MFVCFSVVVSAADVLLTMASVHLVRSLQQHSSPGCLTVTLVKVHSDIVNDALQRFHVVVAYIHTYVYIEYLYILRISQIPEHEVWQAVRCAK